MVWVLHTEAAGEPVNVLASFQSLNTGIGFIRGMIRQKISTDDDGFEAWIRENELEGVNTSNERRIYVADLLGEMDVSISRWRAATKSPEPTTSHRREQWLYDRQGVHWGLNLYVFTEVPEY